MTDLAPQLKVTDLRQGVKNPERVNVFVNGRFSFSLDIAQLVEMKLKVGVELSEAELDECKRASEFGKMYQRTLEWVLMRPRSERETRIYLQHKKLKMPSSGARSRVGTDDARADVWSQREWAELSREIIDRLKARGYLDDRKFAKWYVENRFVKKGVSQKRLKTELISKGVAVETINEVLDGRDDEDEIRKIISRKRTKYDEEKLLAYLCRQGFSYELAKKVLAEE